jgi:hypothetical protein
MSRRQLRTDDEEGFIRAFKDEILDTQEVYGVRTVVWITVSAGKPGLVIRGHALSPGAGELEELVATIERPYPSHSASRLHAALYAAAIALSVGVSRWYEDTQGKVSPLAADATRKG